MVSPNLSPSKIKQGLLTLSLKVSNSLNRKRLVLSMVLGGFQTWREHKCLWLNHVGLRENLHKFSDAPFTAV